MSLHSFNVVMVPTKFIEMRHVKLDELADVFKLPVSDVFVDVCNLKPIHSDGVKELIRCLEDGSCS